MWRRSRRGQLAADRAAEGWVFRVVALVARAAEPSAFVSWRFLGSPEGGCQLSCCPVGICAFVGACIGIDYLLRQLIRQPALHVALQPVVTHVQVQERGCAATAPCTGSCAAICEASAMGYNLKMLHRWIYQ